MDWFLHSHSFSPPAVCHFLRFRRSAGEPAPELYRRHLGRLQFEMGANKVLCWNWILFLSTARPPSYAATQSSHSISILPCENWSDIKMWAKDREGSRWWQGNGKRCRRRDSRWDGKWTGVFTFPVHSGKCPRQIQEDSFYRCEETNCVTTVSWSTKLFSLITFFSIYF